MAFADKTFGTGGPSAAAGGSYDADRLLAGYRAARAQQALFDLRQGPASGYDEFVGPDGKVRPAWTELADAIGERGRAGLDRLRSVVRGLIDHDGITYTDVEPGGRGQEPRPWQLDTLPIVLSAADWEPLEAGLLQRSRVLDAVLADLYGPRSLLTEGVLPPELLFGHPGYLRAANGIEIPGRHQLFMHACDVSRRPDGGFAVNADRTQAPSGAGYAL
ncbi:circularly permuted type 2 ATP-grasp protein, partial [Mycobacterium avium]